MFKILKKIFIDFPQQEDNYVQIVQYKQQLEYIVDLKLKEQNKVIRELKQEHKEIKYKINT